MSCRACGAAIEAVVDLGRQPAGGRFPLADDPPDGRLPLRLGMCRSCGLAQLADPSPPEADDPDAPSPLSSTTMRVHARGFVDDLVARGLATSPARILSLASHGGHLAPFLRERGLSATLMEQDGARAGRLAAAGEQVIRGPVDALRPAVETAVGDVDLIVDSFLLAHLEHPRAALAHLFALLAPGGTVVLEFDDLLATIEGGQWDAVGHGHPVYLSLGWLCRELGTLGLGVIDAAPQPVYGGALRVFARAGGRPSPAVDDRLAREAAAGLDRPAGLVPLAAAVDEACREVVPHLLAARTSGRRVVGYGAPGRAITFLNALEIGPGLLPYVVDRAAAKQGRTIPGVRIPILSPDALAGDPPDEVLILTWNIADEVRRSLVAVLPRTRFMVAVPRLTDVTGADEPSPGRSAAGGVR